MQATKFTPTVDQLRGILTPTTGPNAVQRVRELLDASSLYVADYEFGRLVPLDLDDESIEVSAEILNGLCDRRSVPHDAGFLVPFLKDDEPVLVALMADEAVFGEDQRLLGALFGRVFDQFELFEERRRVKEMSPAGQVQWDELPVRALHHGRLRAAGALAPAYTVAGDLFDIAVQPDGDLAVVAMDAMGHGTTATLSAVLALSTIRARRREGATLVEQFSAADQALVDEYDGDRFVTAVGMAFSDDWISVVNAGHEPLRRLSLDTSEVLSIPTFPPLGVESSINYQSHQIPALVAGESIGVLSDGVSAAENNDRRLFGAAGIETVFRENLDAAPLALSHHLARAVTLHSGELVDDVTAVFVKAER